ncbi:hypothetical protein NsoK4_06805 [Nitrosopumilus sp. K4]|uniref:hypothetical protein n=1 Tax=Nitrosopumilus sp. K4 TaxID=2795383 RepID=UPI001BA7ACDA|nr:hypothetical protein [Nitrosopumilus sp. K4]QUC64149.1 hypothetical protein NsoK4_06805 [Nitrosopumilus sp. K4]
MPKKILVREVDDEIHNQLNKIANELGVSLNSIAKDALDKWIKHRSEMPKKHDLIIYGDEKALQNLLKSMDRFAKEGNWFRAFCGPPTNSAVKLLSKLKWFDGTIKPYKTDQKNISKYCGSIIQNIDKESKENNVCCTDFILEDISRSSFKDALLIEKSYNKFRINGMMFCLYHTNTLLGAGIEDIMDLFVQHDQIFILKGDELHKLHVTKENLHKLFMN